MVEETLLEKIMESAPKELRSLAIDYFATSSLSLMLLKGDGSDRRIYLISPQKAPERVVIGVYHESIRENSDFILIAGKMAEAGIAVPTIYSVSPGRKAYLQEYLGKDTLADMILKWREPSKHRNIIAAYRKILSALFEIQHSLPPLIPELLKSRVMARDDFRADLEYFQRDFIKRFGFEKLFTASVQDELTGLLIDGLAEIPASVFVYRDFQARNFMWKEGRPWFIDFQSAYLGAPYYDLASCLYASKSGLSEEERTVLLQYYFEKSSCDTDYETFLSRFYLFVLIRRLRSLGSYGFLSMEKNKTGFYTAIQPTLEELIILLEGKPQLEAFSNLLEMIHRIKRKWQSHHNAMGMR